MEGLQQVCQVHCSLGLHEGIMALIELIFNSFLISIRCDSKHFSPEAVVLAIGKTEDIVGTCQKHVNQDSLTCEAVRLEFVAHYLIIYL